MKTKLKALGDFLVGLARLILICGAVFLFTLGLDSVLEKTLPVNVIDVPALSSFMVFIIVAIVLSVKGNSNRGWLCFLAAFAVWWMTLDMNHIQERLAVCAMAAIAAWPITAIKKIKQRPKIVAVAVAAAVLFYVGGYFAWTGITHHGNGFWTYGGEDVDEHSETVSEHQYKRECYAEAGVFFLFAGVILYGVIENWKERNKLEKSWERIISNPENIQELHKHPENYQDDFKQWIKENHSNLLL